VGPTKTIPLCRRPAKLAADLQAVADDGPLCFAREPVASRYVRWIRRNRRRLSVATPIVLALGYFGYSLVAARLDAIRREVEVKQWVEISRHSAGEGKLEFALSQLATASRLAEGDTRLRGLLGKIREEDRHARATKEIRDKADELSELGEKVVWGSASSVPELVVTTRCNSAGSMNQRGSGTRRENSTVAPSGTPSSSKPNWFSPRLTTLPTRAGESGRVSVSTPSR
jgi:hypothetical protein